MILRFNQKHKQNKLSLLQFLKEIRDRDFYYTRNNLRQYIDTEQDLVIFCRECEHVFVSKEKDEINGIIAIWKSAGGNIERNYVKLTAESRNIASKLLQFLEWHYPKTTHAKLSKHNKFLKEFFNRRYKFCSGRGKAVLIKKEKFQIKSKKE